MDKTREEDLKELEQAMMGVAPLGRRSRSEHAPFTPVQRPSLPPKTVPVRKIEVPNARPMDGREILNWRRSGLLDKDYQNLRRGRLSPAPEEIDLHGKDAREACDTIAAAIADAQRRNERSLCLIHGKGHHSESRSSRLKGLVDAVLRQHPEVLGFHSVPRNTGAVNLLLRRPRG